MVGIIVINVFLKILEEPFFCKFAHSYVSLKSLSAHYVFGHMLNYNQSKSESCAGAAASTSGLR